MAHLTIPTLLTGPRRGFAAILKVWARRARTRRRLAGLDRHLLRDIGVDPMRARREAERPFWD